MRLKLHCVFHAIATMVALATLINFGHAQGGKLEFADRIRLISCDPALRKPCFRLKFNVVDDQGSPLNLNLPPNQDLHEQMTVTVENQQMQPFFALAQSGSTNAVRGRVALILVDISGSMNKMLSTGRTRFQTAQQALQQFLQGFDPAVDRVAMVPFESHNVAETIDSAHFASTKAEAITQIESLPDPQPKNNTALYSAVELGLRLLAKQASSLPGAPETLLIIMTDGKNEVFKGDDAGLLDGPSGLEQASKAVKASGIQVVGIGFGDFGSIDETALRQISTKYYMAEDLTKLSQIFALARTLLTNRIVATFASPGDDRSSLEGRTIPIKAELTLPGGKHLESAFTSWAAPEIGVPTFDGKCDVEELKAALQLAPSSGNLLTTLRPVLVFFGLGTVLLVLWFWVPRFVWPEQYIGTFQTRANVKWGKTQAGSKSSAKAVYPAPRGFDNRKGFDPSPRGAADRTVVQPDFSKTRLQKRPSADRD
jgi:Mg-chelatase subunit ChlD